MPYSRVFAPLSPCGQDVRAADHDRFLTCLFAPTDCREALFAVLAFNLEIAKTREVVREPLMGQIRLQWWRDTIEGLYHGGVPVVGHDGVRALAVAIERHHLSRDHFDTLIDAREADLDDDPLETVEHLVSYAESTGVPLVLLGLEVLGAGGAGLAAEAARVAGRHVGTAWALTGLVRAIPFHAAQGRVLMPTALLQRHGVSTRSLLDWRPGSPVPPLAPVVAEVVAVARHHLAQAQRVAATVPRTAVTALLSATLAELYLGTLARVGHNVFDLRVQRRHPGRPLVLGWRAWRGRFIQASSARGGA